MSNSFQIVFNGNDLSTIVKCRPERPIMPPVEVAAEAIGGRNGEMFKRSRMQGFIIPVTVWVRATDRASVADTRRQLAAYLWTDEPAPLYLPDDPSRYYLATVEGETALEQISDVVSATVINFRVCDPIAYGDEAEAALTNNTAKTVSVGGTWKSWPIIASTTVGGTWRIRNVTTGEFVEINSDTVGTTIVANKTVVCDMAKERLTLNGSDVGVSVDSNFFAIDGTTQLKVEGGTDTTVEWRERWI